MKKGLMPAPRALCSSTKFTLETPKAAMTEKPTSQRKRVFVKKDSKHLKETRKKGLTIQSDVLGQEEKTR
jgi:hypothetical protein